MSAKVTKAQEAFIGRFAFEDPANPEVARLRKTYGLDKVVAPAEDDLGRLLRLAEWTYDRFKVFGKPTARTENALEIVEKAAAGHTFYCAHYAIVMSAAATALGWTARPVSVRRADESYRGSNHNVAEVWSDEFGKWVFVDPTYKCVIVGADGVPLNTYELGRQWFTRGGEGMTWLVGARRAPYTRLHMPIYFKYHEGYGPVEIGERNLRVYACLAHVPTNCLLGRWADRSIEHWDDWPELEILYPHSNAWADAVTDLAPYYDASAARAGSPRG